ncbi:YfgM family protein [Vibrio sp. ZSDE26]|uniref:Ancillary SecYEG translocon subunit n=1 Tax=Vibrio amylolyticus TaxID=2847292 RepID=A0A9X1XMR4_9VIBR|nr:YfgM family protein [Vibrio amylolyticus]
MEVYDSEEQQVEAIKEWWKENGKAVILGAVVGLGGLFGWRYYQDSALEAKELASESYTQAMTALLNQQPGSEDQVQSFIDANAKSEYSVLAALQLAKVQVEASQLDEALAQLEWAKANSKDEALKAVISYRIARIQAEQENYADALAELTNITDANWSGRIAELRGDIELRQGNEDAAYAAYSEAQQAMDASQTLQLKLDDLAK